MKLSRFILFLFAWMYGSILILSAIHELSGVGVRVSLLLFLLCLGCWTHTHHPVIRLRLSWFGSVVLLILALTFVQGFFSAPNTTDAMVYHLPRVMQWIHAGSVFQTHLYTTHDYMPPFAEYLVTFFYLLVGSDRLAFLPQWLSMVGIFATVVGYLRTKRISKSGVWAISLLILTTPILLLESTSTQTDLVMGFLVLFSFTIVPESIFLSILTAAFGVITKQVAIFFLLPTGVTVLQHWNWTRRFMYQMVTGLVIAVGIGGAVIIQNVVLYGVPIGAGSKGYATDAFTNARFDFQTLADNVVRNTFIQIPLPVIGQRVQGVLRQGFILDNPGNTWPGSVFHIPSVPIPQEDIAPSPVQLLVVFLGGIAVIFYGARSEKILLMSMGFSFLVFCFFLKWQPYNNRLDLTLLLLALPMTAVALWRVSPRLVQGSCVISVLAGFAVITGNTSRPLVSYTPLAGIVAPYMPEGTKLPQSIFVLPRRDQYYVARPYWDGLYSQAAVLVGREGATTVQFITVDGFIYPMMVELQQVGASIAPIGTSAERVIITGGTIQSPSISVQ